MEELAQTEPSKLTIGNIEWFAQSGENIASSLTDERLDEIARKVVDDHARDEGTREKWRETMGEAMKLAMQVKEAKDYPIPGASNIKIPILTIGALQFASRAFPQVVKSPAPVKGKVNGEPNGDKIRKALRMGQHMSYQLTEEMDDWVEDMDTLLHVLPITGCAFKKTYFDGKKLRSHLVWPEKLVFDFYAKSVEEARCVTEEFTLHPQEILGRMRSGFYHEHEIGRGQGDSDPVQELVQQVEAPQIDDDTPHVLLEQHRWLDLDEDGFEEPYIVTVDKDDRKTLRIAARFDPGGVVYNESGQVADIVSVPYYTQYKFFPDFSGGNLGIGWGHLLFPINEVINTTTNQLLDAGHWQNTNAGFVTKSLAGKLPKGVLSFKPNEMKTVDAFMDDLQKGIYLIPKVPPSPVLFQLLGLMMSWAQRLTTVTESMGGENPPTNQPASTTLALLDQGMKVFQGVYKRIFRAFNRELKKLRRLNKLYMPTEAYFRVLDVSPLEVPGNDERAAMEQMGYRVAYLTDYQDDGTDVEPSADPEVVSEQQLLGRVKAVLEGANAGMAFNPQWIAQMFLDAIGIPKAQQEGAILPPQPPPPDPKLEVAKLREETERGRIATDAQLKQVDMQIRALTEQSKSELGEAKNRLAFRKQMATERKTDLDRQAKMLIEGAKLEVAENKEPSGGNE